MPKVKVKLLRALNGQEIGSEQVYDQGDADRLAGYGSVEILGPAPEEKAEGEAPANKAEKAAPKNKARKAAPTGKAAKAPKPKG